MKKVYLLLLLIVIAGISPVFAANPDIFFSDLIDGPRSGWEGSATKGAAVTIWGKNFGATRGSNFVSVGGINLSSDSDYAEWGITSNNARDMERITIYLKNTCALGTTTISVTVGGVTSNTLAFYVRNTGSIYFVDHSNGNDSYNGRYATSQGSNNGPWKTLLFARQQIIAGDILYIRNGTYNEIDAYNSVLFLAPASNGSANNYSAFVGYPGELPIIDSTGDPDTGGAIRNCYENTGYTVISKLKVIPRSTAIRIQKTTVGYYRIVSLDIDGQFDTYPLVSTWSGAIGFFDMDNVKIFGCKIHAWGRDKYDHAMYIGVNEDGGFVRNYDMGWNEIYNLGDDSSGIYIHPKDTDPGNGYADELDIHDNLAYNLSHAGILLISRMRDVRIWNNIIYNCGSNFGRVCYQFTPNSIYPVDIKFFNNLAYSQSSAALLSAYGAATTISSKNNIFYSLNSTPYLDMGSEITKTSDYDLYYGNGSPPTWATHAFNSNPQFYDVSNHDFHLQNNSYAKDKGTSDVNAIVNKDYDGILRPQGAGYDIGAYEYASDSTLPAAVDDLSCGTVSASTVALTWIAPGNDGDIGQAASYDIRYSSSNITDVNWASSAQVSGEPSPSSAGTVELFTIGGLSVASEYYFALKTTDYANNTSPLSNVASGETSTQTLTGTTNKGSGGGGSGGCFIATAAYNSPVAAEVTILRQFRNNQLSHNKWGREVIKFYDKHSPPIARYISKRDWAKCFVRAALKPVIWIAKRLTK